MKGFAVGGSVHHPRAAGSSTIEKPGAAFASGWSIVDHPRLFLQALKRMPKRGRARLRGGPEGECEAELWRINKLICRVRKRPLRARKLRRPSRRHQAV